MVSPIRSATSRPAVRRACCTARITSRARPSAASSGVTAVSSRMKPPPGSVAVAPAPSSTTVSMVYSPASSLTPPQVTTPSGVHRPVAGLAGLDDGLHVAAQARARGAGVDGEPLRHLDLLGRGVGHVQQRHLADVHLVGDQRGEVGQRLGIRGHDRQLRTAAAARAACSSSAARRPPSTPPGRGPWPRPGRGRTAARTRPASRPGAPSARRSGRARPPRRSAAAAAPSPGR